MSTSTSDSQLLIHRHHTLRTVPHGLWVTQPLLKFAFLSFLPPSTPRFITWTNPTLSPKVVIPNIRSPLHPLSFSGLESTFSDNLEADQCTIEMDQELELSPLEYGLIDTETFELVRRAVTDESVTLWVGMRHRVAYVVSYQRRV